MFIAHLRRVPFRVPFRAGFATADGPAAWREGVMVRLTTNTGAVGLGEASPLPERGGRLRDAVELLDELGPGLVGEQLDEVDPLVARLGDRGPAAAAVACALDTAVLSARAVEMRTPLAAALAPSFRNSVSVNATVGAPAADVARREAAEARAAGFRCLKLKVGMAASLDDELRRVAAVRDALGPEIALRLDANGAWTVDMAIDAVRAFDEYDIEFIEQPVAPGDLDGMRSVRQAVRTPVAADEAITGVEAARRVLERDAAAVLVVKPMTVGGPRSAVRIIEMAQARGASAVVTTTIDTGVGIATALHVAATLPEGSPACGLATASLLVADLVVGLPSAAGGRMALPRRPGLGVDLDEAALARHGLVGRPAL